MGDLLAGTTVKALDTTVTVANAQATTVTTTSTSYTTSGTDCAVSFVAPTTGRVIIHTIARCVNDGATGGTLVAPETRTGGTVGSGTVVESAADTNGTSHYGTNFARGSATHLLTGLTAGSTYNVRLLMRVTAGTGSIANREVIIQPAT